MEITWEEPPKPAPRGRWQVIVATLKERPGHWARVAESTPHSTTASQLRRGVLGGVAPGELEAVCRRRLDGNYAVYARYVGGEVNDE